MLGVTFSFVEAGVVGGGTLIGTLVGDPLGGVVGAVVGKNVGGLVVKRIGEAVGR